jgi:hypothetical protein
MAGKNSIFTDNSAPSADAAYLNLYRKEANNIITGTGQTLNDSIDNQAAISIAQQSANNFYIDSGSANAYVLTLSSSFTSPVSDTVGYFTGMEIKFRAGNAGTGIAAVVNVGNAGNKSLKEADGVTNPSSIPTTQDSAFRFDGTVFRKVNFNVQAQATESTAGISKRATEPEAKSLTNDSAYMTSLKTSQAIGQIAVFEDQKASGTAGGTPTTGARNTRTLNTTVKNNITGASLSFDQVTLPTGTYYISCESRAGSVQENKLFLRNVTDSTDDIIGLNSATTTTTRGTAYATAKNSITIAGTKVFQLENFIGSNGSGGAGLGYANGTGAVEVYSQFFVQKIA